MGLASFPTNKWTYIIAAILFVILWIVNESFWGALITTILIFIGLFILFLILAKLF